MIKSSTIQKVFMLISLSVVFIGCTKKTTKINFNDINTSYNEKDGLIIESIVAKEESESFTYKIRIPKIVNSRSENNNLKEFNDEIRDYADSIVNNLKGLVQNPKKDLKKAILNIDYEIYHGYNIYTLIITATQEINDTSITNYRSYYIRDNGNYIYNIEEIIKVEEAFPYFTQRIKEKTQPNKLLFDLQQAVIYFENKRVVIKFPPYVFNLDDTEYTENIFEFNEEEVKKYIK
ncbi:hypothetical protein [Candidatus Borreliella tachyglossi]|uniref:hypothetical protein n=1 Tax=Candidatus Borreliella tachyglossi TaxID=1964448 RepID=UPI0040432F3D